jgi:hypothetical protein
MAEGGKVVRISDFKGAPDNNVEVPAEESLRLLSAYCRITNPKWRLRLLRLIEQAAVRSKQPQG